MSGQNACCFGAETCPANQCSSRNKTVHKIVKPLFSFVVSVLLALSVSHVCELYSSNNSIKSVKTDMSELMAQLRNEVAAEIQAQINKLSNELSTGSIKDLIKTELQLHDADGTGKPDYALEVSGGSILSIRDTQMYSSENPVKVFGIPLCAQPNTPRAIIQKGVHPGECWAFKGSKGCAVIKLMGKVQITDFSMEHVSLAINPIGELISAPKDFSILGLDSLDDKNPFLFGNYTFDNKGPPIQNFKVQNVPYRPYEIVELEVHSNHGQPNYTCVYRIRVHGTLISYDEMKA